MNDDDCAFNNYLEIFKVSQEPEVTNIIQAETNDSLFTELLRNESISDGDLDSIDISDFFQMVIE